MTNGMRTSYYNIDAILSEEELVSVTNFFDFSHLAHLDPDYVHPVKSIIVGEKHEVNNYTSKQEKSYSEKKGQLLSTNYYLREGTYVKMPLWSIENWSQLGFIRLSLPRHFGRKARDRLEADPVSIDLRNKSERFFMSGMILVSLIKKSHSLSSRTSRNYSYGRESQELKRTLLQTYTGVRLRRTFDWTLSSIEDDISSYTLRLTEMERVLFDMGAAASHAHAMWKLHGSRRIQVSQTVLRSGGIQVGMNKKNNHVAPKVSSNGLEFVSNLGKSSTFHSKKKKRM